MPENNNVFPNLPSTAPRVEFTRPDVPQFPAECFGSVEESLGPNGADSVPQAAESLFPSGSAAGAMERPDIANGVGQMPQQGDRDFADSQLSENPTPAYYASVIDSFGRFDGKP
jgi:hypothetical protein